MANFTHRAGLRFYLDTSAVFPLVLTPTGGVKGVEAAWVGRLTTFIAKAQAKESSCLCSVLVIEEIASISRSKKQREIAKLNGFESWKEYRENYPTQAEIDATQVQADALGVLKMAVAEFKTYKITVEYPVVLGPGDVVLDTISAGSKLREAHRTLMTKCPTIDSMDALHVVFGSQLGCRHFVTFDKQWMKVPDIYVLN